MTVKYCDCGEKLVGHEDESSTKCRWCVTGWNPKAEHSASADCQCGPTLDYVAEDGTAVYVHHEPN